MAPKHIPHSEKKKENKLVASYTTLRNILGIAGLLVPILCILTSLTSSGTFSKASFSDYYYSSIGDIIVTLLCVQGAVLIIYNGYNTCEQIISTVAGIIAILIANFPTEPRNLDTSFSVHTIDRCVAHIGPVELHLIFAVIFFIILALIPFWWFTKNSDKQEELNWRNIKKRFRMLSVKKINHYNANKQKAKRNFAYVLCSLMIIGSLVVMVVFLSICKIGHHGAGAIIFYGEAIIFAAYSSSWLIKGHTFILDNDEVHWIKKGLTFSHIRNT